MIESEVTGKKKGRHPVNALSAAFVRSAKGPALYADGNGLYLKVDESGARRWIQRLVIHKKRREIAIGPVSYVSLADARESAAENRKIARTGGDPLAARKMANEIPCFADASRTVYEIHRPSWRNAKHAAQVISTLETYTFPQMGKLSVSDVDGTHVLAALLPIWLTKPATARRVKQRISVVMKWAIAQGWRQNDPTQTVASALPKQDSSQKKRRKALNYTHVSKCIDAVRASQAGPPSRLALEFLVLTAARSGEVRGAVWDEIDIEEGTWTIPAQRMKARMEHCVPLSGRAVSILTEAQSFRQNDLIFPGIRYGKPLGEAAMRKLLRETGVDCDIHGFRTSFRTWTQEQTNAAREVCEAALAHKVGDSTEAAYARSNLFEKRRLLMEQWANYLKLESGIVTSIGRVS